MNDRTLKLAPVGLFAVAALAALCVVLVLVAIVTRVSSQDLPQGDQLSLSPAIDGTPRLTAVAGLDGGEASPKSGGRDGSALPESTPTASPSPAPVLATTVITHVVQSGENLFRISLTYGVTVGDIMAANDIVNASLSTAGQVLRIPVTATELAATGAVGGPSDPAGDGQDGAQPVAMATAAPVLPTATSAPLPRIGVNGLALESIVVMPDDVRQRARQIYERGQELGRNPHAYSKLGDSTIEAPHFMTRFDEGPYLLGDYGYLQEVIDYFAGSHSRQGVGVRRGFHSWTVTDPLWADKALCLPNENSVACEIRLHNPSIMLIRLGSNDAGVPAGFEQNMRQVIDIVIENGVIPVLATKADRFEGSNINNEIIRRLANEYQLPLWDFDLVASTIAGRGLDVDGVHLTTFYAHDYTSLTAFQRGHSMHNLTALMTLDVILREVIRESE